VRTYLNYISTKFRPIWMRFGARVSKTPCQTLYPWVSVLARCFAYACTKSHPNRSKFGGDIAQINAHRFLLSPINFIINSTSQRPWEQKGQKTRVTPYPPLNVQFRISACQCGNWLGIQETKDSGLEHHRGRIHGNGRRLKSGHLVQKFP